MKKKNGTDNSLPKKLEKEWVAYFIDMVCGSHLLMINMRFPERAQKLQGVLVLFLNDHYAKFQKEGNLDPGAFVKASSNGLIEILNSFMSKNLVMTLVEGMPKQNMIIKPGNKGPRRMM